ncbi:MAG: carbamoyl-phosphate synthase (glutamine-hydrolyzing) large subunit [Candidatus Buchananbacteria bacterium]
MKKDKIKKVLILGSGALKIGEAGEFDYSGSQAIKAFKELGIKVVLINPNIATIQTSDYLANRVYFLPVSPDFVCSVIKKEKPDAILLGFGGQTALNCGVALAESGVLKKYKVKVLGTSIKTIKATEDRAEFAKIIKKIGLKCPNSQAVYSVTTAQKAAKKIGFPIIIRSAYSLGGKGSGVVRNDLQLKELAKKSLAFSKQILVEEYLDQWKEIEYEVMRDQFDNCITVCNMENFDPMGIHTGESIVVAPSQTLDNYQYHLLRQVAIKIIRYLGIVGECNIQFALDPKSNEYRIIEVNARLSRSSALASKVTGYPIAFIAAKLAAGCNLSKLNNSITKSTTACFEPALDYVAVKIPRWDLKKFKQVSPLIGSEMKSVGEVMAIGRKFEEALQKAIRMLNIGADGLESSLSQTDKISNPTPQRIFSIAQALFLGKKIDQIHKLSGVDLWFLEKILNIVKIEKKLKTKKINADLLLTAKKFGFSDKQIAKFSGQSEEKIRSLRIRNKITPFVKKIDTLAAEYPAQTNYLYLTYNAGFDDLNFKTKNQVMVLGSGPYCIGSSVEFDWCAVNAAKTLRQLAYKSVMINCNPETVSTDYDECDKLYFEELTLERVLDIYDKENPKGIIISMGGQIPNNLALDLEKNKVKIMGTKAQSIDRAENRHYFSKLIDELKIDQPAWQECLSLAQATNFAKTVGYPVLIRPSYVLSGAAMSIAFNGDELKAYLLKATQVNKKHPVVVTKFITKANEIEFDGVAQNGRLLNWAISEHIENAGIHSGDATIVLPVQNLSFKEEKRITEASAKICQKLKITGPFNIQFLVKDKEIKVIECNLRASRTLPFISKIAKINFVNLATKAILGRKILAVKKPLAIDYIGVKAPQFSFSRLDGADPVTGVEMASTGEVGCLGDTFLEAFLKSILAVGFSLPQKNILISLGGEKNKSDFLESAVILKNLGFNLYTTSETNKYFTSHGLATKKLAKENDSKLPKIKDYFEKRKIELMINVTDEEFVNKIKGDYEIRRKAIDYNIGLITNIELAKTFIQAIAKLKINDLKIKAWDEYI